MGSFDLEAVSPTKGSYTLNASPIAVDPAKTSYSFAWTVAQPLGGDYKLHLVYRDGAAQQRRHGRLRRDVRDHAATDARADDSRAQPDVGAGRRRPASRHHGQRLHAGPPR